MAGSVFAAAPADAPAGTTGVCKDGSYVSAPDKKGACRGHKGVKDWYAAAAGPMLGSTMTPTATPTSPPSTSATTAPTSPTSTSKSPRSAPSFTPPTTAAAGGGPGMVWANDSSKVYHCQSDKWYGKTKHGEYMREADAKAKGFHAEHGKTCA